MRHFTVASLLFCLLTLTAFGVRAQASFIREISYASSGPDGDTTHPTASKAPEEMVVLTGKITNPAGALPGAVVTLTGTKKMAVTNADGEFQFTLPAGGGPVQAVVSYVGYADESMTLDATAEATVTLRNARVVVVARRQQLKAYLRTARKQVKRSLKKVRK